MAKLFGQIAFVLVICLALFALIGLAFYAVIGGLLALTVFALLMGRGPWALPDEDSAGELSYYAAEFFWRLLLALALGAIWPSLPAIAYVKKPSDHDDRRAPPLTR